ncbi:TetR/AcrR family transcriptional regulator [Streptomyces sp. P1-3]|uniref:TetR/AcrR family transcriptional regulator n=1 Tax=Streptomyces sp. P1-3 TaxID=3421658 RepID=UPI003D3677B9
MAVQRRRERERAERHRLIVEAARELAKAEGRGAVTTRRLSERVEYSQPVLYSHFASKGAIVAAVAVDGFGELAAALRGARAAGADAPAVLRSLADAYLEFARARPAVYAAMFVREVDVEFGTEASPAPLKRPSVSSSVRWNPWRPFAATTRRPSPKSSGAPFMGWPPSPRATVFAQTSTAHAWSC